MTMTTTSLCSRRGKMPMTMTNRTFSRKVRRLIGMTMPSLFPDEGKELLRKALCMVMPPPPFFRRRGDAYDYGHHSLLPEE